MFTLNELSLICGVAWDDDWNGAIRISFHEQDGGISEEVTVANENFSHRFYLSAPAKTGHLPSTMVFKVAELRTIIRKLKQGYKNMYIVLPLEFTSDGFEVKSGPGRGTKALVSGSRS